MAKSTFYNINKVKHDQIIDSLINLFAHNDVNDVNITMVIKACKIPRGSFYQYFDDVEDAYLTMIKSLFEKIFVPDPQSDYDIFEFSKFMVNNTLNLMRKKKTSELITKIFCSKRSDIISISRDVRNRATEAKKKVHQITIDKQILIDNSIENIKLVEKLLDSSVHYTMRETVEKKLSNKESMLYYEHLEQIIQGGCLKEKVNE
ncbi:MAG: TetR/AcrR family transcriptional regulator [Mycoplasmatales bacterium]